MKTKRWAFWIVIFLSLLSFGATALAQEEDGVIFKKKTVYNFEDDTITGDLTKPDEEFLTGRKLSRHKSLIRVRENFREKVLQSAKDL